MLQQPGGGVPGAWGSFYNLTQGENFPSNISSVLRNHLPILHTQGYFCCYHSFCYLIAICSKLFLTQDVAFFHLLCLQFYSSTCHRGRRKEGGEQAAYGLESLGGNTNLQSTIPKPQQTPLYHFSVPLRNSLRKFCSFLKLQMCDIDMLSVLQATLTPFSLLPVNKY